MGTVHRHKCILIMKGYLNSIEKMRKYLMVFAALICCAMATSVLTACSDNDAIFDSSDNIMQEDSIADYTVIFWGMAGRLDHECSRDLAILAQNYQQGKIGKNVQFAGLWKTSLSKDKDVKGEVDSSYDKTMYFDSETIGSDSIRANDFENLDQTANVQKLYKKVFDNMGGKVYGDTLYALDNADNLAGFIKEAAKKFPARHYVLMLFGHGSGFTPLVDTPITKACVHDDFFNQKRALSADAVVSAVNKSGVKMQTLFTHCCLMATLENIAAYSQVFDYGILSAEDTYSGYFPQYVANLSAAGDNETKMQQESRKLVDYYVDEATGQNWYTSHGFYDLRKASTLLSATKEAAVWLATNYAVNSLKLPIEKALLSSISCTNLGEGENNPKEVESMRKLRESIQNVSSIKEFINDMDEKDFISFLKEVYLLTANSSENCKFCMADVLRNATAANLPQEKTAELQSIYEKYMTALKGMAYIRTTDKPASADADYEYIYASPTVNIFSMHPSYYIPFPEGDKAYALFEQMSQALMESDAEKLNDLLHQLLDGTTYANQCDLATIKSNYTGSVFDRQVGWSKFLEQLLLNPSVAYCPDRWQVNQRMK